MSAYIGSVEFEFPLKWIDKDRFVYMGKDIRTRSGEMVLVRPLVTDQTYKEVKLRFEWVPWADVRQLLEMATSHAGFSADIEDTDEVVTLYFQAEKGVESVEHQAWGDDLVKAEVDGEHTDLYTGIINAILFSGD